MNVSTAEPASESRPTAAEIARRRDVKRKYGLNWRGYEQMKTAQSNACAICWCTQDWNLAVDHDHVTGKVRGLLCNDCNKGLGFFFDRPELLVNAARYLQGKAVLCEE